MMHKLKVSPGVEVAYVGPPLSAGPLPALFYFALSDQDSLCLDPFNQPVSYLSALPMRIFSMTLPGHENGLPPTEALNLWASEIALGRNVILEFVQKVKLAIDALIQQEVLISDRLAVAGLSRGAFIATHAAAIIPEFQWILGFAPLTQPPFAKEFQHIATHSAVESLSLKHLADKLTDKNLRFYIGNLDTRVGTRHCFDFIEKLSQTAFKNNVRSPSCELIIGPSIGRDGHGTSPEVFQSGARWIAQQLEVTDVL